MLLRLGANLTTVPAWLAAFKFYLSNVPPFLLLFHGSGSPPWPNHCWYVKLVQKILDHCRWLSSTSSRMNGPNKWMVTVGMLIGSEDVSLLPMSRWLSSTSSRMNGLNKWTMLVNTHVSIFYLIRPNFEKNWIKESTNKLIINLYLYTSNDFHRYWKVKKYMLYFKFMTFISLHNINTYYHIIFIYIILIFIWYKEY